MCVKRIDCFADRIERADLLERVGNCRLFRFGECLTVRGVENDLPNSSAGIGEAFRQLINRSLCRDTFDGQCGCKGSTSCSGCANRAAEDRHPDEDYGPRSTGCKLSKSVKEL